MLNFTDFDILTFDCYGTLIDWETGIFSVLRPVLTAHGKRMSDDELLALYGELEAKGEEGAFHYYRDVLQSVMRGFGEHLGFVPSDAEARALPESLKNWLPFPDTVRSLQKLKTRFQLGVISNVDDDLFAATAKRLQDPFDHVITAQQAQCYKPGMKIFNLALERMGIPSERILHCAQSVYHDVVPARSLGIASVWVNRPSPRKGIGAVRPAYGPPDLEVPNLETLASLALA